MNSTVGPNFKEKFIQVGPINSTWDLQKNVSTNTNANAFVSKRHYNKNILPLQNSMYFYYE